MFFLFHVLNGNHLAIGLVSMLYICTYEETPMDKIIIRVRQSFHSSKITKVNKSKDFNETIHTNGGHNCARERNHVYAIALIFKQS